MHASQDAALFVPAASRAPEAPVISTPEAEPVSVGRGMRSRLNRALRLGLAALSGVAAWGVNVVSGDSGQKAAFEAFFHNHRDAVHATLDAGSVGTSEQQVLQEANAALEHGDFHPITSATLPGGNRLHLIDQGGGFAVVEEARDGLVHGFDHGTDFGDAELGIELAVEAADAPAPAPAVARSGSHSPRSGEEFVLASQAQ